MQRSPHTARCHLSSMAGPIPSTPGLFPGTKRLGSVHEGGEGQESPPQAGTRSWGSARTGVLLLYLLLPRNHRLTIRHIPLQQTCIFRSRWVFMQSQPHISLCSLFPSTVSYPILNYSSNRVLALPPGDPLCSHRACCTEDRILLMSRLHLSPVKFTAGLSAPMPQEITSLLPPLQAFACFQ